MLPCARLIVLIAGAALLAGCADEPLSPAASEVPAAAAALASESNGVERVIEERLTNLDGLHVQVACEDGRASELVALEGMVYVRETVTMTPSGNIIAQSHSMPVGVRGVGVESGHEYRIKEQNHYTVSQREVGYSGTNRYVFEMTNRVTREKFKLAVISHVVIAPQPGSPFGKVVVERETVRAECGD